MISARTKAALSAAKARGVKLGGDRGNLPQVQRQGSALGVKARIAKANDRATLVAEAIADLKTSGATSLRQIAAGLNAWGIKPPRGGEWSAVQVQRVIERAA